MRPAAWFLISFVLSPLASRAEECSGHGTLVDGVCNCTGSVWPAPGDLGYTGPACELPIFGAAISDTTDVTAECHGSGCASLGPGDWSCFAISAPFNSSWNYFTLLVQRTSTDEKGDPDLFGLWTDGSGSIVPNTSARGWDFQDTSSASHPTILKSVRKADVAGGQAYAGAYVCIRAYGPSPVDFTLHATLTSCPSSFDPASATPLECSTARDTSEAERRYTECSAAGECVCSGQWARPVPSVFPGIGFEDCSTPTLNVSRAALSLNKTFSVEHQELQPDSWVQYRFHVDEDDFEVVVSVALEGEPGDPGSADLYLKSEQPAGWGPRQYDLRPRWNAATGDRTLEVVLRAGMSQWRTGVWFAGVVGSSAPVNFTFTIHKNDCPGNCSSHGTCTSTGVEPPQKQCQCDEGYGGIDCSKASSTLEFGHTITQEPVPFELNFFSLPPVTEGQLSGNVELVVEAAYQATVATHWLEAHPSVLLAEADGDYPGADHFRYKLSLDRPGSAYNLSLCPSQVRGANWTLAVYNPMPTVPIGYNVTVHRIGRCLHACSGHGTCSSDGLCECAADWAGGDCSVPLNTTSCLPGSQRALDRPDQHGTCWQECRCAGNGTDCAFSDSCAGFSCQEGWRRRATQDECVQDECVKDEFHADSKQVCLKNCTCPADGGPCTLATTCSIRIDIQGGSGRHGVGGGAFFFWMLCFTLAGGGAVLAYIHRRGVPPWLPIRERGYLGGLYNEMSEHNGI